MISLDALFDQLNEEHFQKALPPIAVAWNSRLRSAAGRFYPGSRKWIGAYPPRIEIASYLVKHEEARKHVRDTLAHEMIHYWLWHVRKPYGHTPEFKRKLKEVGGTRYNPVPIVRPPKYVYVCPGCEKDFPARRRLKGLACLACCKTFANGKFDPRFRLMLAREIAREIGRDSGAAGLESAREDETSIA